MPSHQSCFRSLVNFWLLVVDVMMALLGSRDLTIRIWDKISGNEIQKLQGHTNAVLSVVF